VLVNIQRELRDAGGNLSCAAVREREGNRTFLVDIGPSGKVSAWLQAIARHMASDFAIRRCDPPPIAKYSPLCVPSVEFCSGVRFSFQQLTSCCQNDNTFVKQLRRLSPASETAR